MSHYMIPDMCWIYRRIWTIWTWMKFRHDISLWATWEDIILKTVNSYEKFYLLELIKNWTHRKQCFNPLKNLNKCLLYIENKIFINILHSSKFFYYYYFFKFQFKKYKQAKPKLPIWGKFCKARGSSGNVNKCILLLIKIIYTYFLHYIERFAIPFSFGSNC